MDLSGTWRAAASGEELRRRFLAPDFDDGDWTDLEVPGHWRSVPALADSDGPVLHRRAFEAPRPAGGRRSFVVLDGCFYQGDVFLDGAYLGDTEGYFLPHAFEVTDQLRDRDQHVLAVELTCVPQAGPTKRNLTGAFQDPAFVDPDWNPGGIWRPVRLVETGAVRIAALRVRCPEATGERAQLLVAARLDAAGPEHVELRTTVDPGGVEHRATVHVTAGTNDLSWQVEVPDPPLWWPKALSPGGRPPALVDVRVEARPAGGEASDTATRRTGLRQVRLRRSVLEVNGERLFLKGAAHGPSRMALGEATAAELERDVALAQDAGLDLMRVQAHISRPELYEAADRAGLLLWQDLPLRRGYARAARPLALQQAEAAVDVLAHHPSIAIWCAHDEPVALDPAERPDRLVRRHLRGQVLPDWNLAFLDLGLSRTLDKADGTRPVLPHAGLLPKPTGGTDTFAWLGWYHGDERSLPRWLRRLPALGRFVGAFGAQAVPETADWMEPERWPDLDWERLVRRHGLQKGLFDRRVPPAAFPTFEAWRTATQEHQATLLRHHIEELRRRKYRPTGGFCLHSLADAHPAVSWSVLDHERVPKAGLAAVRTACAPVTVTADRPAATYAPGAPVALDVHVVSDLRHPLDRCAVAARLAWTGGAHTWSFAGAVPADGVARMGTLSFEVPDAPGPLELDLRLDGPATAAARYRSQILPAPCC